MHRASFRRMAIRHGGIAFAITATVMHLVEIVFLLIQRGKSDAPFAFMWSLFFALPSMLLHVAGGLLLGMALTIVLLADGALLHAMFGRLGVTQVGTALLGGVLTGAAVALLGVQNPLTAVNLGSNAFVLSLIPAVGGASVGLAFGATPGAVSRGTTRGSERIEHNDNQAVSRRRRRRSK